MKENELENKVNQLESHIEKIHDMLNLEDRITASDVLCRLTVLESDFDELNKRVKNIEYRLKHIIELPSEINIRLQGKNVR